MEEENKKEEIQSRREFFKNAAKKGLPIVAAIALAGMPTINEAKEVTSCKDCTNGCKTGCHRSCGNNCALHCEGTTSKYSPSRSCETCKNYCAGCSGECCGTCKGSCSVTSYTV